MQTKVGELKEIPLWRKGKWRLEGVLRRPLIGTCCLCLAAFGLAAQGRGQTSVPTEPIKADSPQKAGEEAAGQVLLQARLQSLAAAHHGRVALYATQLGDRGRKAGTGVGLDVGLNPDEPVQTASVIKLAILYHAMAEVRAGRAKWDEAILLRPDDVVGGSGLLHLFDTPLRLTLKDVLTMMVVVSDNTATNLAIDRFGIAAVNARVESLGLINTHLYKKVFKPATGTMPADQPRFGLGKTTPREMATLMRRIGTCRLRTAPAGVPAPPGEGQATPALLPMDEADRAVCAVGLEMLKGQFYRDTVPRYLEKMDTHGPAIASKTGSLDAVRNDVAIVAGKSGPIVLAIFTYENVDHSWTVDNEGEITVARLAQEIVRSWSPAGLDGALLVPGLGVEAGGVPEVRGSVR